MTNQDQEILDMAAAYEAGKAWAKSLQKGDYFTGARPQAEMRYTDARLQGLFVSGALDVFALVRGITTSLDNIILEVR